MGCEAAETRAALETAIAARRKTAIVAKRENGNKKHPVITLDPVVIRDRFIAAIRG